MSTHVNTAPVVGHSVEVGNDVNVVALWTSVDVRRWIAGCVAGMIAFAIAATVGGMIATSQGYEFVFPIKLMGTILLGSSATAYGNVSGLIAGIVVWGAISVFWGFVFGHFVRTNRFLGLLGMGFTWGVFLWIFNWNLFLHSFTSIVASNVPSGPAFAVCLAYGFGMMTIGLIDRR